MKQYDSLDKFLTEYRTTQNLFDAHADQMNPFSQEDREEYVKAMQEMQMANISVDLALKSRHSLLRKALEKIN